MMKGPRNRGGLLALVLAALACPALAQPSPTHVRAGLGSYALQPPPGAKTPPAEVFKTGGFRGPVPTGDWNTSLVWTRYSEPQYAHPLAVRAERSGLRVYYPGPSIAVSNVGFMGGMPGGGRDFVLGHSAVPQFPDARLHAASDWFVTASFASDGKGMQVSYGHGSPFVYAMYAGGEPTLTFADTPTVWGGSAETATLGVTVAGRHYGLFGPTGATWSGLGSKALTCRLAGKNYFSLAVLTDASAEALALFGRHAHAHVTDTKVAWSYDEKSATVTTRFAFTTRAMEGSEKATLFALYPHQWMRTSAPLLDATYDSVRGVMKLGSGTGFTTRATFPGVLPSLPDEGTYDKARLRKYVEDEAARPPAPRKDTYWEGKHLGKLATLLPIAEQAGAPAADKFRSELKRRLEDWFVAVDGAGRVDASGLFHYDRRWGTLIGYPAAYGSDTALNDHHFHYGYFVKAAAEVARHDRAWASDGRWGAMVRMLIRDIACPDGDDRAFARLRCFDPYAGHSWASGNAKFADGNNQESSSEAMNAWAAIILWGEATGDRALRDLGIYLFTTEMEAINAYWFDVLGTLRPKTYGPSVVTMVWGGKGVNETWFTREPEMVHGINWLPIHGGSLYLGLYPEYVRRNYDALVAENGGPNWDHWADLVWMYRALDDPADAVRQFEAGAEPFRGEGGNSRANAYHWVHNLNALGHVDRTVTADHPLYAVFRKGARRTYVVYNMAKGGRTVTFSDSTKLAVPGPGFAVKRSTGDAE